MDSVGLSPLAQELATGADHYMDVKSLTLAGMVIIIFDWLLTFEMEVSHIWQAPWNRMKVLYILSRYMPFIDVTAATLFMSGGVLPVETCEKIYQCAGVMFCIGDAIADLIFTLRTWVVWGKSKSLGTGLAAFYVVIWVVAIPTPFVLYLRTIVYAPSPAPHILGCLSQSVGLLFSVSFAGSMLFNLVMLLLMIIRAISWYRLGAKSDLTRMIYRDGIIYYVYTFIFSTLNFLVILKFPKDYTDLLFTMDRVLHSVLSCRVVLHIRQQRQLEVMEVEPPNGLWLPK
ncbi:hypothetical protein P691DRAFT_778802 [Macrolepiota fuliginosa MF-IS2]|uniref:DUF6533 domain-containing protein n=1 Tax=Macrolepiota fuliginosa MF-IS2 TaxID=1400762 RepID=A0A9P5X670_9AGAR|nr:hypothetical protein P691DRAFT_778802 [Macrolepiota fuliginosa MF-IS2]